MIAQNESYEMDEHIYKAEWTIILKAFVNKKWNKDNDEDVDGDVCHSTACLIVALAFTTLLENNCKIIRPAVLFINIKVTTYAYHLDICNKF